MQAVGVYIFMDLNVKDHVLKSGALMQYLEVELLEMIFPSTL